MTDPQLRAAIVVHVEEDSCRVVTTDDPVVARYAPPLPSPRRERFSPGHLVALAEAEDGTEVVVWRWYDAVVVGHEGPSVRLWEPAHGEVLARPCPGSAAFAPGGRAYASAGLPGADWWVEGPAVTDPGVAGVDLDAVRGFYADHGLWPQALRAS